MGPKSKSQAKSGKNKEDKGAGASNKCINQRKKDSYLADDQNFLSFNTQLGKLGLELRDITGDGNCLFRALSDQLDGNESNHLKYRQQVCEFMRKNKQDFEPFFVGLTEEIENGKKNKRAMAAAEKINDFDKYINNLDKTGTYGGNDALVAFARLYQLEINLHQLDQPIWKVNGSDNYAANCKQIHLSYHNGEHYSSVRPIGDLTSTPTKIRIDGIRANPVNNEKNNSNNKKKSYYNDYNDNSYDNDNDNDLENDSVTANEYATNDQSLAAAGSTMLNDLANNGTIDSIINVTNCYDVTLIKEILIENNNNIESTITQLINMLNIGNNETENLKNSDSDDSDETDNNKKDQSKTKTKKPNAKEKKFLKKQKQMERQRIKVLEEREKENLKKPVNNNLNVGKCDNQSNQSNEENNVVINRDDEFKISLLNVEATSI